VESALAAALGVNEKVQRGPFRARLKHFQRLGLPGVEAGKGSRINYTEEQAEQLLFASILSQMNIDPARATRLIKKHWARFFYVWVRRAVDNDALNGNHLFLAVRLALMEDVEEKPHLRISFRRRRKGAVGEPISGIIDEHDFRSLSIHNLTLSLIKLHEKQSAKTSGRN
jgi:hypothetical protein